MFRGRYDIEDRAKSLTTEDRQMLWTTESRKNLRRIIEYLASEAVADVLPKDSFGQALTYLRTPFAHLLIYFDDGPMPIAYNETEQLRKQVALGRNNGIFIGSVDAGYRAADLMTVVSSAARHDLDVFLDVKDVLDRLLAGDTNYAGLRPDVWKETHPEAIRLYRVEERRSRAVGKTIKRVRRWVANRA
jgi:hypothetical protein